MTAKLICGACRACCQWNGDGPLNAQVTEEESKRLLTIKVNGKHSLRTVVGGDCIYLTDKGCGIHARRPQACKAFDCRELYNTIRQRTDTVMIKVLVEGARRSGHDV